MALAKQCDICGTFYPHDVIAAHNGFCLAKIGSRGEILKEDRQDCCPLCMSEIQKCINRLKKAEAK